jgi:class 3 adenylate cyclase
MAVRNANVTDVRMIVFRIGINLGDVIIEGDDIYGDGVNVAARLQELAEPGGVFVSGTNMLASAYAAKILLTSSRLGQLSIACPLKSIRCEILIL